MIDIDRTGILSADNWSYITTFCDWPDLAPLASVSKKCKIVVETSEPFLLFARALGPRMRALVNLEQMCPVHLGIALRRREAGVAEQFLDGA